MPSYRVRYIHNDKESDFFVKANGKNEARKKAVDIVGAMNKQGARITAINRID